MTSRDRYPMPSQRARADLMRSGLDERDIRRLLIHRVPVPRGVVLAYVDDYVIVYFDLDGNPIAFWRRRQFDHEPKYVQPNGTRPYLYFPPLLRRSWRDIASDPSVTILITEGEKKAAAVCKVGYPCIGLGGVDSWRSRGRPLPEFDDFDWRGRRVIIVFDSDIQWKATIRRARDGLAEFLRSRGAQVAATTLTEEACA